jgi:hypothetical protein
MCKLKQTEIGSDDSLEDIVSDIDYSELDESEGEEW